MNLQEFFVENNKVAVAFSGGVDSSYLLYAAKKCGADVRAYYVKSAFQPLFEYEDAMKLVADLDAMGLHVELTVLEVDVFENDTVTANPSNRCYFCKQVIFGNIIEAAARDGYEVLLDGTNASDDASDRPGMKALEELEVKSPLRLCGLTKDYIRRLSKEAGLFTWDKPSYACLATRIPTGQQITAENLSHTEWAEQYMLGLGFRDFRVRTVGEGAKIQVKSEQFDLVMKHRDDIYEKLSQKYDSVVLDLMGR
ncbi:MAG: ATP-dependent sacrificial sulfur transferase LarE [Lachnospiraceae bacterium]|nr:ATP-dependent sacrificial sulfur transferase LarE [Lachnospiraceae bacterium]